MLRSRSSARSQRPPYEETHSFLLNVSIAGGKHCPAHLTTMTENGKGAPRFFDNYQRFVKQGQSLKTGKVADGKWVKSTKDETLTIDQESDTYAKATGDLAAYALMDIALGNEAGGSLRTSTRPTLIILLLLRSVYSACMYEHLPCR